MKATPMRENEFRTWLEHGQRMTQRPINDCLSRCRRVERRLKINLDEEFKKDEGHGIMLLLADDENSTLSARLGFADGANISNGLASLRSAVKTYFAFCQYK